MSWVKEYTVAVPTYHKTGGKFFFAIELASSTSNQVFTTYRSYSQFRALWKTLSSDGKSVRAIDQFLAQPAQLRIPGCRCEAGGCTFEPLASTIRSVRFPSRHLRQPKFINKYANALSARRKGLESCLRFVHTFFASLSTAVLQQKLARNNCAIWNAYTEFLSIAEHLPTIRPEVLRQPLSLQGWRQQCAEEMLRQDEENESQLFDTLAASKSNARLTGTTRKKSSSEEERLPSLLVRPVKVETMHSFMEEFCEHVLSQYADDIDELQAPNLTISRRWEICLYVACRIGHTYAVQLLLFNYADANTAMADGSTCLHIAARMGRTDVVALLLEEGADANKANDAGVTPLIAACRNGCVDAAKLLLDAGADLSACSSRGTYALHAAIVSQNLAIVELLVTRGANVNVMTASGITPLHFAAKLGSLEISEYLLRHNADPGKRTKNDSDALMIASANGHDNLCELFLRFSGANANASEHIGMQLLRKPSQGDKAPDMARLRSQRFTTRQGSLTA